MQQLCNSDFKEQLIPLLCSQNIFGWDEQSGFSFIQGLTEHWLLPGLAPGLDDRFV